MALSKFEINTSRPCASRFLVAVCHFADKLDSVVIAHRVFNLPARLRISHCMHWTVFIVAPKVFVAGFHGGGGSILFAERPRSGIPTCFWRRSCGSRMCDKSAEGMGINCTAPLALFFGSYYRGFLSQRCDRRHKPRRSIMRIRSAERICACRKR